MAGRQCDAVLVIGGDDGSGSVLSIAILGSIVALMTLLLPLSMGFATKQAVAGAADAAALAAADTASGRLGGFPCVAAAKVAAANRAELSSCEQDGLVATVTVIITIVGTPLTATATAGPPLNGVD